MRYIYISLVLLFFCTRGNAQNYMRDAGIKIDNRFIVSYRQFFYDDMALELSIGYIERGLYLGGLREKFAPALTKYSDNFRLYYGYGVHTGFKYTNKHTFLGREYRYDWMFTPVFGMDGVLGLEYTFPEVPLLVSADIQPYFEFSLNRYFQLRLFDVSLSVKYRF